MSRKMDAAQIEEDGITTIYLDNAATTPVDPRVANKMMQYLTADGIFANPASSHALGLIAKEAVSIARKQVADLIGAILDEIIWTSGATEANNLALKGAAALYHTKGKHIITLKTEHPSVLESCQYLEKQGFFVTYLTPKNNGLLDFDEFYEALREDTFLVSVMHINNEIGVIQDIQKIADITASRGILFHVDAAQSAGKIPIDLTQTPIDLMSLCAHKIYGPKGIGALFVRRKPRVRLAIQIHGGGQEQGMRSGTLPVHQIVGMGEAFAIAKQEMPMDYQKIKQLCLLFLEEIGDSNRMMHGELEHNYPGILNLSFNDIPSKILTNSLPRLIFSTGSACSSQEMGVSYVLSALGINEKQARNAIRISFGRFNTESEILFAAQQFKKIRSDYARSSATRT